jgi:protein-tyrosine phosphatase
MAGPVRIPAWVRRAGAVVLSRERREDALHEWRRRRRGEPALPPAPIHKVVVICQGNICRSPFAESLLAALRPELAVRSAGLDARDGDPAQPAALAAARALGVDLSSHRARRLGAQDLAWADLVLAMEGHHAGRVARAWPEARSRVRLLGDYLPAPPHRIADPYGHSDAVFAATFARIAQALARLAAKLEERQL